MSAERVPKLRALHSPAEAVARLLAAGYEVDATPLNCAGSAEQAGYDAYENGCLPSDVLFIEQNYACDDSPYGQILSEWIHGYWRAHREQQDDNLST